MKKNAFTLIELLVTITILALVVLIAVPTILRSVERTEEKQYGALVQTIILAASSYVTDHKSDSVLAPLGTVNGSVKVTIKTLVDESYLEEPLIDPRTKKSIDYYEAVLIENIGYNVDLRYTYPAR